MSPTGDRRRVKDGPSLTIDVSPHACVPANWVSGVTAVSWRAGQASLPAPPTRKPHPPGSHAYLGNGELIVEGRVVHVQLQVDVLELCAAETAKRGGKVTAGLQTVKAAGVTPKGRGLSLRWGRQDP